ncbi:MAG TPA: aspartyl protease family protein [Pyrinomonadaceae bacterium]|nr:aspartyl protease family protein [Pyrinomonadaceae bacterium]
MKHRNPSLMLVLSLAIVCLLSANSLSAPAADNEKARNRAERALRAGDFQRAEQMYRDILARDDHDLEARLGLSRTLLKQRRSQEAFDHAARVIAVNPLSARAHALLGAAVLASGDFRLSVEEFRTALTLNEEEAIAIAGLAMVDYYENRMASCLARMRRAVAIDSAEPDYIFSLGQAAARSERYKEAADAYERFLLIAPRTDEDRRARIRGLIDFLRYLGQQGSLYNVDGADRTVVSFEAPDLRPILTIKVNGSKQTLRFVLDTGSGMSVLSEETARKIGIRPVARGGMARAVGGGGKFEIVYGYLNSLEIGDIKVSKVPVYIRHFYDETNPVDGYLGIAAINHMVTSVDYGNMKLTLDRRRKDQETPETAATPNQGAGTVAISPAINIPMRTTASGFLSGEVLVDGFTKPMNFIIDTGATVTVLSERTAAMDEAQGFIRPSRMRVYGAAGVAENVKVAMLRKIAIGSYSREDVDAAVLDLESVNETAGFLQSGILGGNFLRHYRIIFDFPHGVMRFEPLQPEGTQKISQPPPDLSGRSQ